MIIIFYLCFTLKCHVSLFFSPISNQTFLGIFCHKFSKQSKNYIKFDFQYLSKATLKVTQLLSPKSSKHRTMEQYHESANCDELDLKSDVNRPGSGKLRVSSQCE